MYRQHFNCIRTPRKGPSVKSLANYRSGVMKPDATACRKNLGSLEGETILAQRTLTRKGKQVRDSGPVVDKALALGGNLRSCWGSAVSKDDAEN